MNYAIKDKISLESFICSNWNQIQAYLDDMQASLPVTPIYASVDIRESRDKYAPVDHNLYPAGFNNICTLDLDACLPLLAKAILKAKPGAKRIAIIPESNTKNTFYLDHLAILGKTVRDAGFDVCFLSLDNELFTAGNHIHLLSHSKYDIDIYKAEINGGEFCFEGRPVDLAILNHDQSVHLPVDWNTIKTPVQPTPMAGWYRRQKSMHFTYYKFVADTFCAAFSVNPDLIQARFTTAENVDFSSNQGTDELARKVDELVAELPKDSKVFVKASQGTYGMGISVVASGEEIQHMNRKMRNKMDIGKNHIKFTSVIIQEGIETVLKYDEMPAEVAIYLIDGKSIGGFMRANMEKSTQANLNSKGMVFRKFCISEIRQNQEHNVKEAVYSVIARLSTIASAYEIREILQSN